jgi:3-oxoacyl-[acyl-carrier protein] reductase
MIQLTDQVAVVTGGSRGIGRAAVRLLSDAGARVVFSFHTDLPAAHALEKEVSESGRDIRSVQADVRHREEAEMLIEEAQGRYGRIDILVANAGIWNAQPIALDEMTDEEWSETIDVNLRGVFYVIRPALGRMKERRSGRIIIVSSTAGQRGEAFHAHYAASKSGLIGLTKSLAVELAPHGVLVNCVAPGWVDTDMSSPALRGAEGPPVLSTIPMGRPGTPEEIAGAVLFLASPLAGYITGEVLNVNGGSVLCG